MIYTNIYNLILSLVYRKMEIPQDEYNEIAEMINSDNSPVGIDAKKTHVLIIHKLMEIEKRLSNLEGKN